MYVGTSSVPGETGRGGGSGVAADDAGISITNEDPLRGSAVGGSGRGSGSRSSGVRGFAVRKLAVDVCGGSFESGGGVIRLHPSHGIEPNVIPGGDPAGERQMRSANLLHLTASPHPPSIRGYAFRFGWVQPDFLVGVFCWPGFTGPLRFHLRHSRTYTRRSPSPNILDTPLCGCNQTFGVRRVKWPSTQS